MIFDLSGYKGIGKDVPAMGPFKNYKPKLMGPGSAKVKGAIIIGGKIAKYIYSRPWAKGTLTGTAIGSGVALIAPSNPFRKTHRTKYPGISSSKRNRYNPNRKFCTCRRQKPSKYFRSTRRKYY